jgi:hypothetical protein
MLSSIDDPLYEAIGTRAFASETTASLGAAERAAPVKTASAV